MTLVCWTLRLCHLAHSAIGRTLRGIALAATGFIWVRYSLVITPVNYSLAAVRVSVHKVYPCSPLTDIVAQVNFFVGSTGLGQLGRIW